MNISFDCSVFFLLILNSHSISFRLKRTCTLVVFVFTVNAKTLFFIIGKFWQTIHSAILSAAAEKYTDGTFAYNFLGMKKKRASDGEASVLEL